MSLRLPLVGAGLAAMLLLGCTRSDAPVPPVDARTLGTLSGWRTRANDRFSKADWREFDAAVQDIRFGVMQRGVTGSDEIAAATCQAIDRCTFSEVLARGYQARIARLQVDFEKLKAMVDGNALLIAKPGDDDIALDLERRRRDQERRLETVSAALELARKRLAEISAAPAAPTGTKSGSSVPAETIATLKPASATAASPEGDRRRLTPATLSRDEALRQIDDLIRDRRAGGERAYGRFPVTFDRDGSEVDGADRELFLHRKAAAAANGHTVIAVSVKGSWWIYDAIMPYPDFTAAVTGHLTAADRQLLSARWEELEAELWARKEASRQSEADALANVQEKMRRAMARH